MARKPALAELSIVADCDVVLPELLSGRGYNGEWHAKSILDIQRALAGQFTPVGSSTDRHCHHWNSVRGETAAFDGNSPLCAADEFRAERGENHLAIIADSHSLATWLSLAAEMLRNRELGWLTLYSEGGKVQQWNRASIRRRLFS